ncbi:ornithine cyclodeaminase family protein [Actinopolyspora sp. H202]|uniref:ornithine cyclodeaminase family protein n=1 Tax=Actinopolyspora sp. H202 TaxID=1500456 RepID=UPI003EE711D4
MQVISRPEVERLLPMSKAIDLVRDTFGRTGTTEIVQPVRTIVRAPDAPALLGSMPARVSDGTTGHFGLKTIVVNPDNARHGLDTHLGVVVAFDPATGAPSAVIEAGSLTAIRTAAASAVATQALAPSRSGTVAIVGTGAQARLHLEALAATREIHTAKIWGRAPEKAHALAAWAAERFEFPAHACQTLADATRDADIVCTVTSSRTPLLSRTDLAPGAHVNAVGACLSDARELAADLVGAARIIVDQRDAAWVEAGDLLLAASELGTPIDDPVELGEVLRGEAGVRTSEQEITVFESLGFAALDVAVAHWIGMRAEQDGAGVQVAMDPSPHQ